MSNRRKLKRPKHQCRGDEMTIYMHCSNSSCGYTDDIDLCEEGLDEFLHEMGAWTHTGDCPGCEGSGTFHLRLGREWLGEPRLIWMCDNGCAPAVLREELLKRGMDAGCLGDYGTDRGRTALYRMFDAQGGLLYVGVSNDFGRRWKQHAESKPWYPMVHRQTVEWFESRSEALAAEEAAIKAEHPLHNIQHTEQRELCINDWDDLRWPERLRVLAQAQTMRSPTDPADAA